jgi:hypothetical protein
MYYEYRGHYSTKQKGVSILICTLMVFAAVVPLASASSMIGNTHGQASVQQASSNAGVRSGWTLQWSHAYGGMGHSQLAQCVGDLDQDGVNEVIVGGYENSGMCRIISYDAAQQTYVEEHAWYVPGGSYHIPTGACILDLNEDGILELCVAWGYTGADGLYAYTWDGTTLTTLDWYHGTGVDWLYDCYACDYNDDVTVEILISNAPNMGTGPYHVTALGWNPDTDKFYYQTSWACPGGSNMECPMVWSGDVDNDGLTEVIADVSEQNFATAGTWALNWNTDTQSWDGVPVWTNYGGATVYGDGVADIDGDGTPEIGIGSYGGTPQGWLFEWDGSTYQQVWNGQYPSGEPVIESVALGDADNDGQNEFCFGTQQVHIIAWDGSAYYEEASLETGSMLAGMNIYDFDTDGLNELKACEIMGGTGSEFIWKYVSPDSTPPMTTCTLEGEMDGSEYISDVTVTLNATDIGTGVDHIMYKLDSAGWTRYAAPFVISDNGTHTVQYYSVDKAGNTEATKSTTFVISHHALLKLSVKGGVGVTLTITNTAHTDQTMVPWSIMLHGGAIIVGKEGASGTLLQLKSGAEVTKKLSVIGFGKTTISVTAGDVERNATGRMILFFVIGVK